MAKTSEKSIPEQARDAAKDMADEVADATSAKVKQKAEGAREALADKTRKVEDAAHTATDAFDTEAMQAQAVEEIARQVDRVASQIRNTDIDRMARTVGDAAQRNPLMFVAGAALAGFAATRFLTARGSEPDTQAHAEDDPWQTQSRPGQGTYAAKSASQRGV